MSKMRILTGLLLLLTPFLFATAAGAAPSFNADLNKVAVAGYDPVAYFEQNRAVRGDPEHYFEWSGVTWYFANPQNKKLFAAAAEKYAPQYGGYCAYAASRGFKANTNPAIFDLVDGKLYLHASAKSRDIWLASRDENIRKADGAWRLMR